MPDKSPLRPGTRSPEQLLEYTGEPPAGEFVAGVMRRIKREQRTRRLILLVSGLIGALFGVAGAAILSDSISRFFTVSMSATGTWPVSLTVIGVVAFLAWLLNDEMNLVE